MVPKVSVIVPVHNGEKLLPLCLDSLMNVDYPKEQLEIIVVDYNSTDDSSNIIKKYPVKYIREKKKGLGIARNTGIKLSSGELIAFTDHDCVVDKAWIANLVEAFKTDLTIGGCGGKILSYRPKTWLERCNDFFPSREAIFAKNFFLPFILTINAMYRRDILYKVGLFDKNILFCEDLDLSWRVCLEGYQLKYVPEAVVYHKWRDKLISFLIRHFKYGYSDYNVWLKYKGLVSKDSMNFNLRPLVDQFVCMLRFIMVFSVNFSRRGDNLGKNLYLFKIIKSTSYNVGWFFHNMALKIRKGKIPSPVSVGDKVIWWNHDNGGIVVLIKNSQYNRYILNDVGAQIWKLLVEGNNKEEIINEITNKYEVDKIKLKSDIEELINEFEEQGIIKK